MDVYKVEFLHLCYGYGYYIAVAEAEVFGPGRTGYYDTADSEVNGENFVAILNNWITKVVKKDMCFTAVAKFQTCM